MRDRDAWDDVCDEVPPLTIRGHPVEFDRHPFGIGRSFADTIWVDLEPGALRKALRLDERR